MCCLSQECHFEHIVQCYGDLLNGMACRELMLCFALGGQMILHGSGFQHFLVVWNPKDAFLWLEESLFTYLHRRVKIYCRS